MFPYTIKYTESESDIKNKDLLYKIQQQCQTAFEMLEHFGKHRTSSTISQHFILLYV